MTDSPTESELSSLIPPSKVTPTTAGRRRGGYWLLTGIVFAVAGAGIAGKFYFDGEAVKRAAAQQKRAAEQTMETAKREIAATMELVRRAFDQAARADLQARESARANAREIERIRTEMETERLDAVAQARREAAEQIRKQVAPHSEAAPATASPGILNIAFVPAGADVLVDDRLAGRSPASIEELAPTRHSSKLTPAGHVTPELMADISGSKTTELGSVKRERATGALVVSSWPSPLEFSIRSSGTESGADLPRGGRTPAKLNELPTGEYVVQFKRAGWPDRTERVTIERGATASVATKFIGGTVTINSSPTGATVIEGGLLLGKAPLSLLELPPRDVKFELRLHGYEPLQVGGTVIGGHKTELNGTLLTLDRLVGEEEVRTPPRLYFMTPLKLGRVPGFIPPYITVSFVVLLNGSPAEIKILDAVDQSIAKRFIEAIAKWKFYPGVSHAGYPVKVQMTMPIRIASRG